jgi:four helix bundle protein
MKNKNDLIDRLEAFSIDVIKYCKNQKQDAITRPLLSQLVRSATSVGANYIEAQQGISRKDFTAKVFIAKKEAAETLYWLKLLSKTIDNSDEITLLLKESNEIMCILQTITTKLKTLNTYALLLNTCFSCC